MDASRPRDYCVAALVLVLTVSGCALPSTRPESGGDAGGGATAPASVRGSQSPPRTSPTDHTPRKPPAPENDTEDEPGEDDDARDTAGSMTGAETGLAEAEQKDKAEDENEDKELHEEDDFKTDLLNKLLGLEQSGLDIFGWVQANYTANPQIRADGSNFLLIPNSQANAFVFQQVYLVFEQRIKEGDQIDCGFRMDNLFGVDAQNFHLNGLLNRTFAPDTFQYDPVQFYGELHLPLTQGLDIRGGRFFALPGYEAATAPGRPLLSTSDMFSFGAHPYTQFGVMATWHVNEQWTLYSGPVNGWNRWINDHDPWSYAGAFSRDSADGRTSLTITLNAGFTQFPRIFPAANRFPPGLSGRFTPMQLINNPRLGYRNSDTTLFNIVLTHELTDDLTFVFEANQAIANHLDPLVPGMARGHASYYGLAGWFLRALSKRLTGVARAEVFRDNNGLLTGYSDNFYEATLGLIYKPVPWFWLRPEARIDWTQFSHPFNIDDSSDHGTNYQFTFGFDAIFLF
jgi:hypothetical protein